MKQVLKNILFTVLAFIRNVVLFRGWPFLAAFGIHWIVFGFPHEFAWFYIGAAVALSWDEIRQRILHWWNK